MKSVDPTGQHALEYHGISMALVGTEPLGCWRVAYEPTRLFAGDPVVVYVSLLGKVIRSEPDFVKDGFNRK